MKFNDEKLWVSGYVMSTIGFELEKVQKYKSQQEKIENDQEDNWFEWAFFNATCNRQAIPFWVALCLY